jgi:hypothetical protein
MGVEVDHGRAARLLEREMAVSSRRERRGQRVGWYGGPGVALDGRIGKSRSAMGKWNRRVGELLGGRRHGMG